MSERECSIVVNGAEDGTAVPEIAIRHAINDPHFILLSFLLPIHTQCKTERIERGSLRAESLLLDGSVREDAGVELPTDGCVHGYTVARLYAFHEHPGQRGAGSTPQ